MWTAAPAMALLALVDSGKSAAMWQSTETLGGKLTSGDRFKPRADSTEWSARRRAAVHILGSFFLHLGGAMERFTNQAFFQRTLGSCSARLLADIWCTEIAAP